MPYRAAVSQRNIFVAKCTPVKPHSHKRLNSDGAIPPSAPTASAASQALGFEATA